MSKQDRDIALDGLRGLAALAVLGGHCILAITGMAVWELTAADFGSHADWQIGARLGYLFLPSDASVMVFFVLSGHVLWESFEKKYTRNILQLPDYTISRLYRLLPVAVASGLLFGLASGRFIPEISAHEIARTMLILSKSTNGALWSLQVEVVCSLLLFLAWIIAGGSALLLILLAAGCYLTFPYIGNDFSLYSICFVAGAFLRYYPQSLSRLKIFLVIGISLLVLPSLIEGHIWQVRYLETAGAFLIVAFVRISQPAMLLSKPVQFLGAVSYPLYLLHPLMINVAIKFTDPIYSSSYFIRFALLATAVLALSIPLSWLLHVAVEKPVMQARPRVRIPGLVSRKTAATSISKQGGPIGLEAAFASPSKNG